MRRRLSEHPWVDSLNPNKGFTLAFATFLRTGKHLPTLQLKSVGDTGKNASLKEPGDIPSSTFPIPRKHTTTAIPSGQIVANVQIAFQWGHIPSQLHAPKPIHLSLPWFNLHRAIPLTATPTPAQHVPPHPHPAPYISPKLCCPGNSCHIHSNHRVVLLASGARVGDRGMESEGRRLENKTG